MPGEYTFDSGSKLLTPVADAIGLSVDKLNFTTCMVCSLVVSIWFYHRCTLAKVGRQTRLLLPPLIGLALCLFQYGSGFKHVLAMTLGCYVLMVITPLNHIHRVIFVFSTGYLSWIHWYRVAHLTYYAIDISGPMMVLVQKVTTLAFNLHDGIWKVQRGEQLNDIQKREAVGRIPTPLEYFSYMLNYQSVFCGPLTFYRDFMDWIDEKHVYARNADKRNGHICNGTVSNGTAAASNENGVAAGHHPPAGIETLPTPWRATLGKTGKALLMLVIVLTFEPYFQLSSLTNIDERGYVCWYIRMYFALCIVRCQYYFAWLLADATHNACGFGFNGYDQTTGEPRWDLISNIVIWPVEFGTSWKVLVDNWNMSTLRWLRRISYDRVHVKLRTGVTYLLSAWWHGFFPAYYILFCQGALLQSAAKRMRRALRPYFVSGSRELHQFYDALTFMATRIITVYVTFPFVYIWADVPLHLYKQMYFIGHILMLFAILIVPYIVPRSRHSTTTTMTSSEGMKHEKSTAVLTNMNELNGTTSINGQNGSAVNGHVKSD